MKNYVETVHRGIQVGDNEVDGRYKSDRVVLKIEKYEVGPSIGLTQSQALNLAAVLLSTVSELQEGREK